MKKLITFTSIAFFALVSFAVATEFNTNSIYSGKVERAYNQADIPLLPGDWKVFDLEKSGSVPSGNFYVYATLVPSSLGSNENAAFADGINYAVLGANSEETDYRKTFYGCDAGFYTSSVTKTSNIDYRGLGNFEETCSALAATGTAFNASHQFYYADCNEICVEVNFALFTENYTNLTDANFGELSENMFNAIRSTVTGNNATFDFLENYR